MKRHQQFTMPARRFLFRAMPCVLMLGISLVSIRVRAQSNAPSGGMDRSNAVSSPGVLVTNEPPTNLIFLQQSNYGVPYYVSNVPAKFVVTNLPVTGSNVPFTNIFIQQTNWGVPYFPPPPKKHWWERFWDWLWH
jgi:hypothetical protein